MNAIEIENLSFHYKKQEALRDLNLAVPAGTVLGYLGPNGAGKTTTIKLLMNLLSPSQGTAQVLGVSSRKLGPKEFRSIGYVSENQEIPGWMRVDQFLNGIEPRMTTWPKSCYHNFPFPPIYACKNSPGECK